MASIAVTEAVSGDISVVADLAVRFYDEEGFDTPADQILQHAAELIVSPAALVLVALVDDKPVGMAITTTSYGLEHGLIAELEDLYVLPDARHSGVARWLIDRSRVWAAGQGCQELEVVIDHEGEARHRLAGFYARIGFVDHGRRLLSQSLTSART